jgi:HlyD family secretion protein
MGHKRSPEQQKVALKFAQYMRDNGVPDFPTPPDTLEVQVALDPSQQGEVKKGDRAQITLPGNKSVTGKVDRLGRVAQVPAGQDNKAEDVTIPA